jgi:hypothetical protein
MSNPNPPPYTGMMIAMFSHAGLESSQHLDEKEIHAFETLIGRKAAGVLWYNSWDDPFPTADCELARRCQVVPHLTWELYWPSKDSANTRTCRPDATGLEQVLAGGYDAYIDQFAADAKAWGGEILLRFLHEFNGDWYTWGGAKNGGAHGGPEKVRRVWRYVVERFRAVGATNVKWMWCPHGVTIDRSEEEWNDLIHYWPGGDYVDWFGVDGYNWYPQDPWGHARPYQSFDDCFAEVYAKLLRLALKPVIIAEFASGEFSRGEMNKAAWITEAFARMKADYPWVKMFTWFNIKKELDWRVNSSPAALAAFRTAMGDPYFLSEYRPAR